MVVVRPPLLLPVEAQQRERYVYSWDALVAAISDYMSTQLSTPVGDLAPSSLLNGRTIRIGASFAWKGVINLPNNARGLAIDGGNFGLYPASNGLGMFSCSSTKNIALRNLAAVTNGSNKWGTILLSTNGANFWLVDSFLQCARAVDLSGHSALLLSRNLIVTAGTSSKTCLLSNASACVISNNNFQTAPSVADVSMEGAPSNNVVSGNSMQGGNVQNIGAQGRNVVVGNSNAGVVTVVGNDVAGNNS